MINQGMLDAINAVRKFREDQRLQQNNPQNLRIGDQMQQRINTVTQGVKDFSKSPLSQTFIYNTPNKQIFPQSLLRTGMGDVQSAIDLAQNKIPKEEYIRRSVQNAPAYMGLTGGVSNLDKNLFNKSIINSVKATKAVDIVRTDPIINLKRNVPIRDVHGSKAIIPEGEALTPHQLSDGKILLKDGETYLVNKNQYQNIKGQSISAEAKPFAPELKGLEESMRGGQIGEITQENVDKFNAPKFSSLQVGNGEGVKNYKEILIKSPLRENSPYNIEFKSGGIVSKFDNAKSAREFYNTLSQEQRLKMQLVPQAGTEFKSSHWDEPNVISHLRLNERTYQGKKVTFMEEAQSDWARQLRTEQGVVNPFSPNSPRGQRTPSHPLVKGNKWQEPTVKRALQEAVANDSDYFAWITGEQTSARYDLATQVDHVKWGGADIDIENGKFITRNIYIIPKEGKTPIKINVDNDGIIKDASRGSNWTGKKLDEVLGKGLADKIMEKETGTLSGEGLKFGGEWADNLYDKQIKNIVEDVTGGKVETLDMGLPIDNKVPAFDLIQPSGKRIAKLTPANLEVGAPVSNAKGDYYIITDILGDGKFKAVPKKIFDEKSHTAKNAFDSWKETFDISIKTTTQQGILLSPEIKAKIRGEAPQLKQPKNK